MPHGAAWTPLVAKLGYVLGFFIVVLGRQQLFTETTLTAVLPAAESAKALFVILLTYIVGLAELTHIIAGSVEAAFAAISGAITWAHCIGGYMLSTLLGNTLGGVLLVAALNHAQATGGKHEDHQ